MRIRRKLTSILRPVRGRIITVGGLSPLSLHSRLVFEGDSITAGSSGPAFSQFAIINSLGKFFCPSGYNQGTGGDTVAQMASQVASVTALSPKVVVFLGGTNDLQGTSDTPEVIMANIRTCIDAYKASGARVVVICVLPRNDASWLALSQARQDDREILNDLIRAQTDIKVVDVEATFDPSTMCVDGLHPNYLGAIRVGNAVAVKLLSMIVETDVVIGYDGSDNHLVGANENPLLTGTNGTRTGTPQPTGEVATGWTVEQNDAMTVACSKTTLNGRTAQRIVVSGTNGVNGRVVNFRNIVTYTGEAGDFWEVWWDFVLASGSQNLRVINTTTDTAAMPNNTSSQLIPTAEAVSGVMRAPMNNALAGSDTSVTMQTPMTFAAGTVAADLTVAAPYYRKVPSGQ